MPNTGDPKKDGAATSAPKMPAEAPRETPKTVASPESSMHTDLEAPPEFPQPVFVRWSAASGLAVPKETCPLPTPPGLPIPEELSSPLQLETPPRNILHMFDNNCGASTRLVMEQLRNDQSIRFPFGWDRINQQWILLETFEDGFPTWDSHIFWGHYNPHAGECVIVEEARQLLLFQQYRFYRELNHSYLTAIERPPPREFFIPAPHELPNGHWIPRGTPLEMGQFGKGCRVPKNDEELPLDGLPCFEPVLRSEEYRITSNELDELREQMFKIGLTKTFPQPFSFTRHHQKEYIMPTYVEMTYLEPASKF